MFFQIFKVFVILNFTSILFAHFEITESGARSESMAGSLTALADDVYTLNYNPAGLGKLNSKEYAFDYSKVLIGIVDGSDMGGGFIGGVYPLGSKGTVGAGWKNFILPGYYYENLLIASYGKNISEIPFAGDFLPGNINLGTKLEFLFKSYGRTLYTENAVNLDTAQTYGTNDPVFKNGYTKTGISLGLAALYEMNSENSVGIVVENINEPDMGLKNKDKLNRKIKFGYSRKTWTMNLCSDITIERDNIVVSGGVEKGLLSKNITLRGGLSIGTKGYMNLSLGFGISCAKLFILDYSFSSPLSGIENTAGSMRISLKTTFSDKVKQEKVIMETPVYEEEVKEITGPDRSIIEMHWNQALEFFNRKDYETAKFHMNEILKVEPENADARRLLNEANRCLVEKYFSEGLKLYEIGRFEEALNEFEKAEKINSEHQRIKEYIRNAKQKIEEKRDIEIERNKKEAESCYIQGLKAYTDGNIETAIKEWKKGCELDPQNIIIKNALENALKEINK